MDNVLAEKWYIPVKQDEALGVCLNSAIKLAQENKLETNNECKKFIDTIVPEAFRKVIIIESSNDSFFFIKFYYYYLVTKYIICCFMAT